MSTEKKAQLGQWIPAKRNSPEGWKDTDLTLWVSCIHWGKIPKKNVIEKFYKRSVSFLPLRTIKNQRGKKGQEPEWLWKLFLQLFLKNQRTCKPNSGYCINYACDNFSSIKYTIHNTSSKKEYITYNSNLPRKSRVRTSFLKKEDTKHFLLEGLGKEILFPRFLFTIVVEA